MVYREMLPAPVVRRILFVVNTSEFFLSHRLPIAIAARDAGYDVHVATARGSGTEEICKLGFNYHEIALARSGHNPFNELITLARLVYLFYQLRPDLVHLITIKPVLYGCVAARIVSIKSVVAAVSGLGTVFMAHSPLARVRRWLVTRLYGAAFRHENLAVIFQNPDDRDALLAASILREYQVRMIQGSGVSLSAYPYLPEPDGRPVVVMAARLLRDKGVFEFVEAARLLRERGIDVDMRLVGAPDCGNPTSISQEELAFWSQDSAIQLLGYRKNIATQYAMANIVCLPSYREGLPKSLVEAAACGRAVVTTDVAGCRDAITAGVTGLLVPVRNSAALADAIQVLINDPAKRKEMGRAGRHLAENVFSIDHIVKQHLMIYTELLSNG